MFKITSTTTQLQTESLCGEIYLVSNATMKGKLESVSGTVYKKVSETAPMTHLGSFNYAANLSIYVDNRDNSNLVSVIADAVNALIGDLEAETEKGGEA